jgi:hypothetical protein
MPPTAPLITLTTDFSGIDGYLGAMKGRLLSLCPRVQLVDITHDIAAQDVRGASLCLARAVPEFPEDSIHVAVIDPGVGSTRAALLLRWRKRWLIGPDNGLFDRLLALEPAESIRSIYRETARWRAHSSFDGLYLFAPAAAWLANGLPLAEIGKPHTESLQQLDWPTPRREPSGWRGEILSFDHFGNALTNLSQAQLAEDDIPHCSGHDWPLASHYAATRPGSLLSLINSDGMLELACCNGSAQQHCRLEVGDAVLVDASD